MNGQTVGHTNGTLPSPPLPHQPPSPTSQATRVPPRDRDRAYDEMRLLCADPRFAAAAFYTVARSTGAVVGPTVALARELARIWGNIDASWAEERDPDRRRSTVTAHAHDREGGGRSSTTVIVAHTRDDDGGIGSLTAPMSAREVNEHVSDIGSRRLREAILNVLPWIFVEEAKSRLRETILKKAGRYRKARITTCLGRFAALGVTENSIETKYGPSQTWDTDTLAHLLIIATAMMRGDVSPDIEFPPTGHLPTADLLSARGRTDDDAGPLPPDGTRTNPYPVDDLDDLRRVGAVLTYAHIRLADGRVVPAREAGEQP